MNPIPFPFLAALVASICGVLAAENNPVKSDLARLQKGTDDSTFTLSPGDVTEAVLDTSGPTRLQVILIPDKSAELSAFTARNLNKQVKIVVGGKVRSEPFVRERIVGSSMEIFVTSPEDAVAAVKELLTSKLAFDQLHKWADASGRTHYSEKPPVPSSNQPLAATETDERNSTGFGDLHGSWAVAKATMNGKESRDRSLVGGSWKFQGSELILQSPQKGTVRFSLKIDAKAQPKAFHLTSIEPENAGSGWMLFSRNGNTLKIAFYDNLQGRPASFEALGATAEPELVVVVLSQKK